MHQRTETRVCKILFSSFVFYFKEALFQCSILSLNGFIHYKSRFAGMKSCLAGIKFDFPVLLSILKRLQSR